MQIQYIKTKIINGVLGKPKIEIIPTLETQNKYIATIRFPVKGSDEMVLGYNIDEWNDFWSNFNSGKYLVEELKKKYDLKDLVIPDDIENWFIN